MTTTGGLKQRPTSEVVVIILAATVCGSVVVAGMGVAIVEVVNPESDTDLVINHIADIVTTILGAVIGFVAGRTQGQMSEKARQQEINEATAAAMQAQTRLRNGNDEGTT